MALSPELISIDENLETFHKYNISLQEHIIVDCCSVENHFHLYIGYLQNVNKLPIFTVMKGHAQLSVVH